MYINGNSNPLAYCDVSIYVISYICTILDIYIYSLDPVVIHGPEDIRTSFIYIYEGLINDTRCSFSSRQCVITTLFYKSIMN